MRFRHTLAVVLMLIGITTISACGDSTAPDPQASIRLAPFRNQTVYMEPSANTYWSNEMHFYAPVGVYPLLTEIQTRPMAGTSPTITIGYHSLQIDEGYTCGDCTQVAWRYYVQFRASDLGEATAEVCVGARLSECSRFKIVVREPPGPG